MERTQLSDDEEYLVLHYVVAVTYRKSHYLGYNLVVNFWQLVQFNVLDGIFRYPLQLVALEDKMYLSQDRSADVCMILVFCCVATSVLEEMGQNMTSQSSVLGSLVSLRLIL